MKNGREYFLFLETHKPSLAPHCPIKAKPLTQHSSCPQNGPAYLSTLPYQNPSQETIMGTLFPRHQAFTLSCSFFLPKKPISFLRSLLVSFSPQPVVVLLLWIPCAPYFCFFYSPFLDEDPSLSLQRTMSSSKAEREFYSSVCSRCAYNSARHIADNQWMLAQLHSVTNHLKGLNIVHIFELKLLVGWEKRQGGGWGKTQRRDRTRGIRKERM